MAKVKERVTYRMKNGEVERLTHRYRLPGKGKGWLYLAESGNVYWVWNNTMQKFVFDYKLRGLNPDDRKQMLAEFQTFEKNYWRDMFALTVSDRVRTLRKKGGA